ncbi:MAG: heparan-alpha-glucosaminide N-acetyltransferase domain-containing protein [bacterium]
MPSTPKRFSSIDIIRGAVMVLMALDHVRVFSAVPAGAPAPSVFFTRWITNFCAPAFIFFAGTSAFLHGDKLRDMRALSKYLIVRGALLIVFEMTVSRLSWTFNLDFYNYTEANVIWAIGWSMIILAALIHLPVRAVAAFGLVIIAGHNITDYFQKPLEPLSNIHFFQILYFGGEFRWLDTGPKLVVLYSIIPWAGVIAAGYAFGVIMQMDDDVRRHWCRRIGLGAIALFIALRGFNGYGNPAHWSSDSPLFFLATTKYPASLQFLLMTLGPCIALIPLLERTRSWMSETLTVFGRVPLFYYLLHIPFIHLVTVLISLVRSPSATWWLFLNHPLRIPPAPEGYRYPLPLLYLVTLLVVVALYFPCRWYGPFKSRHRDSWLKYL